MKVVIMAGGKGTRIASVASEIPKPMIPLCNKPILERQIDCLREQGLTDVIIVTGHLGSVIHEYFGDGKRFGVKISYYHEEQPLGTAGALLALKSILTEKFFLINGDIIFDVDFERMLAFHKKTGAAVTLAAHPNAHPYDSALIVADSSGKIKGWLNKEDPRTIFKNLVNAGIHLLAPSVLKNLGEVRKLDLDREVLKPLIHSGTVFAYNTPEYIHDMGTPKRYSVACADLESGKVAARCLRKKQKAVFLDRDGTINVYKGYITRWEDIELLPGAADAIRAINEHGYLAIVVTNQPVIARGDCTWDDLNKINNAMETLLGAEGAYLDDIFICPHHPDKGFEGERAAYKLDCSCRKPKPGLLLQAAEKYNIDLGQSYMVGDDIRDVHAGVRAGCTAVYLGHKDKIDLSDAICCNSLIEFVQRLQ